MSGYAESWLEVEKTLGARPVLGGSAEEMRAQFGGLVQFLAAQSALYPPPPLKGVQAVDGSVGDVAYRVYTPASAAAAASPRPLCMYFHSGGFVVGGIDAEDPFCRVIAELADVVVVSVGYRHSPEVLAPVHLQDSVKVTEWACEHAAELGANAGRTFTMGTSAGACLSLAVARQVVLGKTALPKDALCAVVSLVPCTVHPDGVPEALRAAYTSLAEIGADSPVINEASMRQFYALSGLAPDNKDYFPLVDADSLALFPPTYVATCGKDPLRDDGRLMAQALSAAGVPVRQNTYPGLPHVFWIFPSVPEGKTFVADTMEAIRWALGADGKGTN